MRRYKYGYCCINHDTIVLVLGVTMVSSVYPVTNDPAILKTVQDKFIKQGHKEIISFSFSQPAIMVATATKEKCHTDATITMDSRLVMKLILLTKGNKGILHMKSLFQ